MNKWRKRYRDLFTENFVSNNCTKEMIEFFYPNDIAIYLASLFDDILRFSNDSLIAIDNLLIKSIKEHNILMIKMCEIALSMILSLKYQEILYLNS